MPGPLTQFSTLDALLAGEYESGLPVSEALALGDVGVGCGERLGGEVVILGGAAWEFTLDRGVVRMRPADILPFAEVCAFPDIDGEPLDAADLDAVTGAVEARLTSRNLFHAVRVDGVFGRVRTRVTPRQRHPFPSLAEVAARQVETEHHDLRGSLVGFWAPTIYQGVTVAGLHAHVVADDRSAGGHVLAVGEVRGLLRIAAFDRFELRLPTDPAFLRDELTPELARSVAAVEGHPSGQDGSPMGSSAFS